MKLLVVIPAFNEAENIPRVMQELRDAAPDTDYAIINDGSLDNTADLCRENGWHLINLPVNLGLTGAFQTGVRYAAEHGYDGVLQLDADGQHDPRYIDDMTREELLGLLGRLKDLYDDVLTQEPEDDESEEYLDWVEGLEALDDLMDDITDRLEE